MGNEWPETKYKHKKPAVTKRFNTSETTVHHKHKLNFKAKNITQKAYQVSFTLHSPSLSKIWGETSIIQGGWLHFSSQHLSSLSMWESQTMTKYKLIKSFLTKVPTIVHDGLNTNKMQNLYYSWKAADSHRNFAAFKLNSCLQALWI